MVITDLTDKKPITIEYPSPSGKINISKVKPPFKKLEHGFLGVLAEDVGTGKIQCHICGIWLEDLSSHIFRHKIKSNDYREKFGILQSTALRSRKLRAFLSKALKERKARMPHRFTAEAMKRAETLERNKGSRKGKKVANEAYNKKGLCDLQLKTKVLDLAQELGRTPRLFELDRKYGRSISFTLRYRYGSYQKMCREMGIPEVPNEKWNKGLKKKV